MTRDTVLTSRRKSTGAAREHSEKVACVTRSLVVVRQS
ncbi:hypothetical protein SAMN04489717_2470 [Actinopolymorpha singaporensis]|uniref:Uncharacterized protein n=1 Tax=Actinopolymorpha singaporensis TaxID=117157 RepID=A0A1H1RM03_9ACTN|nr:hypothetical protein SAMN04489717_2470 [Actinopolymorpha singaporensis]